MQYGEYRFKGQVYERIIHFAPPVEKKTKKDQQIEETYKEVFGIIGCRLCG